MTRHTFHAPYTVNHEACSYGKETKEGWVMLTNFTAQIDEELVYHDGEKITTVLLISGKMHGGLDDQGKEKKPRQLPTVTVTAAEFASGSWVGEKWGMQAIVFPSPNAATDVRACIQISSADTSLRKDIFTHTGWAEIRGKPAYLSTTGAITTKGLDSKIIVQLPSELSRYALPDPAPAAEDFADSVRLLNLGPKQVTWVLLLATIRASIGDNNFAVHLAGRTGTFKSEIASLFQSFYGPDMNANHLPCSWNSTANALEALCFRTKDALVVIDDFVPQGTTYNIKALQQKADNIIRAQGNQAGRARLTDISSVQQTMYPRGIILSTGEDIPDGHSVRARMMIVELSPGSISIDKLTAAQAARPAYSRFMSAFIAWWAGADLHDAFKEIRDGYRKEFQGVGHTRTPTIMAELVATAYALKEYADANKFYPAEMPGLLEKAIAAIRHTGEQQGHYLHGTDPVTIFCELVRGMMATGQGHMKTRTGGIPNEAPLYGWVVEQVHGDVPTYKSHGPKLGWIDAEKDELYIDPNAVNLIKGRSNGKLAVTNQILIKRLKESGIISRVDTARDRNTVRITVEGHSINVIVLRLSLVMDLADQQNQLSTEPQT